MTAEVLVTGADGALGRAVLGHFHKSGIAVRVLLMPGKPKPQYASECVWGDVRDFSAMQQAVKGVQIVIHMAGLILSQSPQLLHEVNALGTKNLIDACLQHGVNRFLYISSISVIYPHRNAYAESKWQAEEFVRNSGLAWTILRPTLLVGKGGGMEYLKFGKLIQFPLIPLPQNGRALKRPVHIQDLADGIFRALQSAQTSGKIYALAGLEIYSLHQILCELAKEQGISSPRILPLPLALANMVAKVMDVFPGKLSARQTLMGLIENAAPEITEAQVDFGYAPQTLKGRWLG